MRVKFLEIDLEEDSSNKDDLVCCVSEIVSSYFSNNKVDIDDISKVIANVHAGLSSVSKSGVKPLGKLQPAISIKKSINPDYIICLEDGKKLKMLKRHLKTAYDMTPEDYREKWSLPHDYPMVAPNYAKQRSALAKDIGLGKK